MTVLTALGHAVLHLAWQAPLIASTLVLVLALLRRRPARWRYRASWVALLLVPLAFGSTWMTAWSGWTLSNVSVPVAGGSLTSASVGPVTPPAWLPTDLSALRQDIVAADRLPLVAWLGRSGLGSAKAIMDRIAPWAAGFWLLAAAAGFGLLIRRVAWVVSLVRRSREPGSQVLLARFGRLAEARGLGGRAVLRSSGGVVVPCVVGPWRPYVLLPAGLEDEMPTEQVDALMAHELEHARRGDLGQALLQAFVQALFAAYPAVHGLAARLRMACEEACDDAVAGAFDPRSYARALLELSTRGSQRAVFGSASTHGDLLRRVRRLLGQPVGIEGRAWRQAALASLVALVVGAGLVAVAATPIPTTWVPRPTHHGAVWLWLTASGAVEVGAASGEVVFIEPGGSMHLSELSTEEIRSWSVQSSDEGMDWRYTFDGEIRPMDEDVQTHLARTLTLLSGHGRPMGRMAEPTPGYGHSQSGSLGGRHISIVYVSLEEPWRFDRLHWSLLQQIGDPAAREQSPPDYESLRLSVQKALVIAHQVASHGGITEAELQAFLEEVEQRLLAFEESER